MRAGRSASLHKGRLIRCRTVIDLTGMGLWETMRNLSIIKKITSTGKLYFPESTVRKDARSCVARSVLKASAHTQSTSSHPVNTSLNRKLNPLARTQR